MSKFLPCKKVCPVVAELKHDVANRDCEIRSCKKTISKLIEDREALAADLLQFAAEVDVLTSQVAALRAKNAENECRIAKGRQALFGICDLNGGTCC